jgi:hypothetical protein|eukprot:COSAG02_NODE_5009_length_4725_cov_3.698011_1_plen_62_part_00
MVFGQLQVKSFQMLIEQAVRRTSMDVFVCNYPKVHQIKPYIAFAFAPQYYFVSIDIEPRST